MSNHDSAELIGSAISYGAMDLKTESLISNVQTAVASGSPTLINVSLDALEQFFGTLWELHEQVSSSLRGTSELWQVSHISHNGEHRIEALHQAVTKARDTASSSHSGLHRSQLRTRHLIERNLQALYDTYAAYVDTDAESAKQLDTAGETLADGAFIQV